MVKVENPYASMKEIKREDITADMEVPKMPEKPNVISREKKEELITSLESQILEIKDKKMILYNKQSELNVALKKQKPNNIKDAELARKKLIEEKSAHLKTLKEHNQEKNKIKEKIAS